jgi:hypothetical protein
VPEALMTDYSGKFYGWRSVFAGIVVSYVGAIVFLVIFIFTVPGYILGVEARLPGDCIESTRVCVGAPVDSIESAMSFSGRRPSGIVEVFACDSGRESIEGNVEAWFRNQCKDGAYYLQMKHSGHFYSIEFKNNSVTEINELIGG